MKSLKVLMIRLLVIFIGTQVLAQNQNDGVSAETSFSNMTNSPIELQKIENSLKNLKINKDFFEGLIREEFDSIKYQFDELNKIKIKKNLTGRLEANGMEGIDLMGCSLGIIDFRADTNYNSNEYRICYSYLKKSNDHIKIRTLTIYDKSRKIAEYPKLFRITGDQLQELRGILKGENNTDKIELLSSFLKNSEKSREHGIFPYGLRDIDFARYHGNLSWYYLLEGNKDEALVHAVKGLNLSNGNEKWINVNLILAYFYKHETEKGLEIFLELKKEKYYEKTIREMLISDMEELEEIGFMLPNKIEIRQALKEQ